MIIDTNAGSQVRKNAQTSGVYLRLGLLSVLLIAEWVPISASLHTGWGGRGWLYLAVAFCCIFLALSYRRAQDALQRISLLVPSTPARATPLVGHLGAMIVFLSISFLPHRDANSDLERAGWFFSAALALVFAGIAFLPLRCWRELVRNTGPLWIVAAGGAWISARLVVPVQQIWNNARLDALTGLTFHVVEAILHPWVPGLTVDPAHLTISSRHFSIQILTACSGVEGAALMLVFSIAWLWFFRRECRFPQALALVPASVLLMWVLNAVRIALLFAIGNAGAPAVAVDGAHSQAGWIAFNLVALGVCVAAAHVPWWSMADTAAPGRDVPAGNATAEYVLPLVVILAGGMFSRAVSGVFEWLYPLRVLCAAAVIWSYRKQYAKLNWRAGWLAVATGLAVFAIWIAPLASRDAHSGDPIAAGLLSLPAGLRVAWLAFRILGAVITVPIAEELAFRGFLIRRLISSDFTALSPRRFTYFSVLASSLIFGVLHSGHWMAGIIAGLLYAITYLRRGRIGDAVAAHAVTNLVLAVYVISSGNWYLW